MNQVPYYYFMNQVVFALTMIFSLIFIFSKYTLPRFVASKEIGSRSLSEKCMSFIAHIFIFSVFKVFLKLLLGDDCIYLPPALAILGLAAFMFNNIIKYKKVPNITQVFINLLIYIVGFLFLPLLVGAICYDIINSFKHLLLVLRSFDLKQLFLRFTFLPLNTMNGADRIRTPPINGRSGMGYNSNTNSSNDWENYIAGRLSLHRYLTMSFTKCTDSVSECASRLTTKYTSFIADRNYNNTYRVRSERINLEGQLNVRRNIINAAYYNNVPIVDSSKVVARAQNACDITKNV